MFVILILLALLTVRPYLSPQFPFTHDGENHLARFANYKLALKEGQFPPRWAPNLLDHYGYPVFNYNYPLANILSLPLSFLKINYEVTFKILVFSFILFGLYGLNLWLKKFSSKIGPRLVGLLAFASAPYLVNLLYFRGSIGELMAMMILPWLFYFIDRGPVKKLSTNLARLIFETAVWAMFFLSHNVSVLFGVPLLLIYALVRHRRRLLEFNHLIISFGTGLLLSLWFWLPAILEKKLVIIENADLSNGYLQHFPTLSQVLFAPLEFGFSVPGSVDGLSFKIGWIFLLAMILLPFIIAKPIKKLLNEKTNLLLIASWLLLIFQLPLTAFIWSRIPLVNYIQFPWRLSLFLVVIATPLIVKLVNATGRWIKVLVVGCLLAHILAILPLRPVDYFHRKIVTYDVYPASTSTANENLPQDFTFEYFADGDWQPTATIISGVGEVIVNNWRGSVRNYQLQLTTPAVIVEPTANFAGWETTANHKQIEYLNNDEIGGRIAYQLPAGDYSIVTRFTQKTQPRQLGNWLSLSTAIIFISIIISLKVHAQKNRI